VPLSVEIDCYKYKNGISNDSTQLAPTEGPTEEDGEI
jgi:hypothetical protein